MLSANSAKGDHDPPGLRLWGSPPRSPQDHVVPPGLGLFIMQLHDQPWTCFCSWAPSSPPRSPRLDRLVHSVQYTANAAGTPRPPGRSPPWRTPPTSNCLRHGDHQFRAMRGWGGGGGVRFLRGTIVAPLDQTSFDPISLLHSLLSKAVLQTAPSRDGAACSLSFHDWRFSQASFAVVVIRETDDI